MKIPSCPKHGTEFVRLNNYNQWVCLKLGCRFRKESKRLQGGN
jgi:hypothetical protein